VILRANRCLLIVILGLLSAACTGTGAPRGAATVTSPSSEPNVGAGGAPSAPEVPCVDAIDHQPPRRGLEVVLDAVALPTGLVLQANESSERGWLFAKQGLVVRADTVVDLEVPAAAAAHVRIGWGSPGPQGHRLRVPGCPSESGWLAFAGGYTVNTPRCVPLMVRSGEREVQVRIGVGVPCPRAPLVAQNSPADQGTAATVGLDTALVGTADALAGGV
jgi:hypothetical protein